MRLYRLTSLIFDIELKMTMKKLNRIDSVINGRIFRRLLMKFSRIFAMFMFAAALTGSMPVQAEGIMDWLVGLFEDKAKPAQPNRPAARVAPAAPMQPRNPHNGRGTRNRRGHGPRNNPVRQAPVARQPQARTTNPRTNPRAKTATAKVEKIKKTLIQYAGLIAVGIVISAAGAILLNPAAQQKIRDILGYARPAQDVNNLFRDVKDTAKGVKDFAKNVMDTLSGDDEEETQQP